MREMTAGVSLPFFSAQPGLCRTSGATLHLRRRTTVIALQLAVPSCIHSHRSSAPLPGCELNRRLLVDSMQHVRVEDFARDYSNVGVVGEPISGANKVPLLADMLRPAVLDAEPRRSSAVLDVRSDNGCE